MTANIKYLSDGMPVFASTKDEWWGYTSPSPEPMTVKIGLERTGLDKLTITEKPIQSDYGIVATHKAIYLEGDGDPSLLGVVGKDRKTFQPIEMLSLADTLADASGGSIETVGMLGRGQIWFATVLFPQTWTIGGEKYKGYLFVTDSADGSSAATARKCMTRVVCGNTFAAALFETKGQARYSVRHTSGATLSVDTARKKIGMEPEHVADFEAGMKALFEKEATFAMAVAITDELFGTPAENAKTSRSQTIYDNRLAELNRLWKSDTQASTFVRGNPTDATVFQTISEYLDWTYGADSGRTKRKIMGDTDRLKAKVLAAL